MFLDERVLKSDKREGLILFPRVGRSDSKTSALWFGPRLGKSIRIPENYDEYLQDAGNIHIIHICINKYIFEIFKLALFVKTKK